MKTAATKNRRQDKPAVRTIGADLSLNHGAVVALDNGELAAYLYYTNVVGSAARSKLGTRLPDFSKTKDRHLSGMKRLAWVEEWFGKALERLAPNFVNIEDYALDVDHGVAYQGEVGGAARLLCWHRDIPFRLTDPTSVKMFGADNGKADKDAVEAAVLERFGVDFGDLNLPQGTAKKQNRQTSQDLADAFTLARLCWIEVQLRAGQMRLSELRPKEIQVFNRITKAQPCGLLDREWIRRDLLGIKKASAR